MPSLTVAGPYPDAATGVLDGVIFQTFYRQLGIVSINFTPREVYAAAQWLAANGRGGTVSVVGRGRLFQWDGLAVAPEVPGSPTIDVWLAAWTPLANNVALIRKGFWSLDLFPSVTAYRLSLTTRAVAAVSSIK